MIEINLKRKEDNKGSIKRSLDSVAYWLSWKNRFLWNRLELKKAPDNSEAHFIRGYEFEGKGRKDLAEVHYRTAVDLDPENYMAWQSLASLCSNAIDRITYLTKAAQASPADCGKILQAAAENLANLYKIKNPEEAAHLFVLDAIGTKSNLEHIARDMPWQREALIDLHENYIKNCKTGHGTNQAIVFYKAGMDHDPKFFKPFFIKIMKQAGLSEEEAKEEAAKYAKPEFVEKFVKRIQAHSKKTEAKKPVEPYEKPDGLTELGYELCNGELEKDLVIGDSLVKKIEIIRAESDRLAAKTKTEDTEIKDFEEYSTFLLDNANFVGKPEETLIKLKSLAKICPASSRVKYNFGLMIVRKIDHSEYSLEGPNITSNSSKIKKTHAEQIFARILEADPSFCTEWEPFYSNISKYYSRQGDLGRQLIAIAKGGKHTKDISKLKKINSESYESFSSRLSALSKLRSDVGDIAMLCAIVEENEEENMLKLYKYDNVSENTKHIYLTKGTDEHRVHLRLSNVLSKQEQYFLRGYREIIKKIADAKKSRDNTALADELSKIGLCDLAIKTAELAEESDQKYMALGHAYETKWMDNGKRENLEKAYNAYWKAARIIGPEFVLAIRNYHPGEIYKKYTLDYLIICKRLTEIAFTLKKYDDFRSISEMMREPGKEKGQNTRFYLNEHVTKSYIQLAKMSTKEKKRLVREEVEKASAEPDLAKRIDMLKRIEEEHPNSAKAELGSTCAEYAPQLTSDLKKLCGVE